MRPVYYPPDEYACDMTLSDPRTVHMHCSSDADVVEAYIWAIEVHRRSSPRNPPPSLFGPPYSLRYVCITGPGGRVLRGFEED